jgi:hypothetical protein
MQTFPNSSACVGINAAILVSHGGFTPKGPHGCQDQQPIGGYKTATYVHVWTLQSKFHDITQRSGIAGNLNFSMFRYSKEQNVPEKGGPSSGDGLVRYKELH